MPKDMEDVDFGALEKKLGEMSEKVKGFADEIKGRVDSGDKVTAALKEQTDELLTERNKLSETVTEQKARLDEVEQKLAQRAKNGGAPEVKTFGEAFVSEQEDKIKSLGSSGTKGRIDMQFKATITSLTTDAAGSAGAGVNETRLAGVLNIADRRMTVRDLLTPGQMDGSTLEYVKEKLFTNSAAPIGEGLVKPQSDLQYEMVTTSAKVIAHYMKASRQILDDFSQLRSLIDFRLMYGLKYAEEAQLLNGSGVGQNLSGLVTEATAYAAPFDPAGTETAIDVVRLAMLQAELAEYPPTGVVMHPSDWARIELLKDVDTRYLIGMPQGTIQPRLWGLPVVATQAMTIDKFLVGAYRMGAQVFDRWQARVEVATENEDDFIKNMVTVLCEERLALAIYRPEAFIYGDFGNVSP